MFLSKGLGQESQKSSLISTYIMNI